MARSQAIHAAALALVMAGGLIAGPAVAADAVDNLAKQLIQLRGEVEELHGELEGDREAHRARMKSLAEQKGELEAAVNREQLTIKKLDKALADNRAQAREAGVDADELKPVVRASIAELREHIDAQLPFKLDERRASLATIERELEADVLPPHKAVNRLWAFYEDEIRMATDNGVYRQTIALEGDERLADVARLGTAMMYFRTDDDQLGQVSRDGDDWSYEILYERTERQQIANLFDSMEKQIRTGYFELPNPTLMGGGK